MKTLKESILNRSSHGGEGFKAQRREMIEKWLNEYNIRNYTINDDFTIDVDGNVDLFSRNLIRFLDYIQFGVIKGFFDCSNNKLTSLKGSPKEVRGYFSCSDNQLTSLEGAPENVGGTFICSYNKLTSLEGAPKETNGFYCNENLLTSLKGAPKKVKGKFDCRSNIVQFTDNDVRKVCDVRGTIFK